MSDDIDRLERLFKLRESGALTAEEYQAEKAIILAGFDEPAQPAAVQSPEPGASAPPLPLPALDIQPPSRSKRVLLLASVLAAVLVLVAAVLMWLAYQRSAKLSAPVPAQDAGITEPGYKWSTDAPAQAVPSPASNASTPAAAVPLASDNAATATDSDDAELAGDEAYYAEAEPFMRLPVRVVSAGRDYCCLTMGQIYESLQPDELHFAQADRTHITLTSTDVSVRPWRLIGYEFVFEHGSWHLKDINDTRADTIDASSAVTPDQVMIQRFKLTPAP